MNKFSFLRVSLFILLSPLLFGQDSDLKRLKDSLNAIDNCVIEYQLVNKVFKTPARDLKIKNIKISSPNDPAFKSGVAPQSYSIWGRPIRYSARPGGGMFKGQYLYLFLPKNMKKGMIYQVKLANTNVYQLNKKNKFHKKGKMPAPEVQFTFEGDKNRSKAISVNQVGYLPEAPKFAYLTAYAGLKNGTKEKTDIDFSKYKTFYIISSDTKKKVYQGNIKLSPVCQGKDGQVKKSRLSESRVWEMDFTKFQTPGSYRIKIPGVGMSYPFEISQKIYNYVFGVLTRGMYHQRCGYELTKKWTRHPHPACHTDDGLIPDVELYKDQTFDYLPQKSMVVQKCTHGHHDAGDFGKYTFNGSLFASSILLPFEVFPEKLKFDNSPIPESVNSKADLLEEVKWELDWLSGMQDPDDGGVHIVIKPAK